VTWLLKLYPPAWRRRYGRELAELIATQPTSLGTAIDLVAGAIDAWIHPQPSTAVTATTDARGERTMLAKMMRLRCAGYGPTVTRADVWKSLGVTLGGTVVLTLFWMWANRRFAENPYIDSLALMVYFIPLLMGLRYTSLKGRPARVQAIFILGLSAILLAVSLIATWLGARL
jgi:hypothetical protein